MRSDRGDGGDLGSYTAARWAALVRTLVVLGCPPSLAAEVALSAIARVSGSWSRLAASQDVDVTAYRELLESWAERRGTPWWEDVPAEVAAGVDPALERRLDALTTEARAALALSRVAGLGDDQVAVVLGISHHQVVEHLARASEEAVELDRDAEALRVTGAAVGAIPPDPSVVRRLAREQRGRRRRVVVAATTAGVVLVAAGTWLGTRSSDEPSTSTDPGELATVAVSRAENPAPIVWFANGVLHLDHVTLELPPLSALASINAGAVYGGEDGAVVFVSDDGERTPLGTLVPGARLVASEEEGWVAWVEPGQPSEDLVVYDVASREVLARRVLPEKDERSERLPYGSEPIAIDQGTLFYADAAGDHAWDVNDNTVAAVRDGLLDVAGVRRTFQQDANTIVTVQPFFDVSVRTRGSGAQLAPDGEHVLTRTAQGLTPYGTTRIFDTRSGDEVRFPEGRDGITLASQFGPDGAVSFVVARLTSHSGSEGYLRLASGPLEVRTCSLYTRTCEVDAAFTGTGSAPLLAQWSGD